MNRNLGQAADPSAPRYYEEPAIYVFDLAMLASTEYLNRNVPIDGDSDFVWLALAGTATAAGYDLRFRLPSGRQMMNAYVQSVNLVGTAQFPVALPVGVVYRRSSTLGLDIRDTSAAPNTVQLVFYGLKRFTV